MSLRSSLLSIDKNCAVVASDEFLDDLHLPCGEDESSYNMPKSIMCLAMKGFLTSMKFYKSLRWCCMCFSIMMTLQVNVCSTVLHQALNLACLSASSSSALL
ncbi:hypothetical protein DPMN_106439 [Dreissena polymorpha]|uniref:Uncharacterized protein n=1 Tax=Dreissena polymorpha TaxID=45954 RepID=A0A9D4K4Z3_DREPO|nr:hypothetical protein DPMN_106439 [Dreissena polymorpha]